MNPIYRWSTILCLGTFTLGVQGIAFAQKSVGKSSESANILTIAPASASLLGGKASLFVQPLICQTDTYVGEYQLKVTPYFFKNEKGKIAIPLSAESLRLVKQNKSVKFAGTATTTGNGQTRAINGLATPSGVNRGVVTFTISTDNGPVAFTSAYKLEVK